MKMNALLHTLTSVGDTTMGGRYIVQNEMELKKNPNDVQTALIFTASYDSFSVMQ